VSSVSDAGMESSDIGGGRPDSQPDEPCSPTWATWQEGEKADLAKEITKLRYQHILKQIQFVDANVFRFLAIYQTLISALVAGQVLLFVNRQHWSLGASTARVGLVAILVLETLAGVFASLMIIIGVWNWIDYRSEECDISDAVLGRSFRQRPSLSNWYRWYETYLIVFIFCSLIIIWILVEVWMIPAV
jgi:hypothetical protein